jgi:hypothetical protein
VKCGRCAKCYWLDDAEELGTRDVWATEPPPVDPAWDAAEFVEEPTEAEYYVAIEANLARDREQERTLRLCAWWRANDAFRERPEPQVGAVTSTSPAFRKNLQALAELLNQEDEADLIMKAEVLRELGEFEAAIHVLSQSGSPELVDVVRQMRTLIGAADASVRELRFDR